MLRKHQNKRENTYLALKNAVSFEGKELFLLFDILKTNGIALHSFRFFLSCYEAPKLKKVIVIPFHRQSQH